MIQLKEVIHLYLGCALWSDAVQEPVGNLLGVVGDQAYFKVSGINYGASVSNYKPILRPLPDITEDECLDCANILGSHLSDYGKINEFKELCNKCFRQQTNIHGMEWFKLFVFLLSKGFDLFGLIESDQAVNKLTL